MGLLDIPDGALAVVLEYVSKGPDGIADIARASLVNRHFHAMALERQGRMRTLDVRSLGRRARHAVPHLARRMKSLKRVFCDRTNITDECVTALLTASGGTIERLSLADCRHLRALHSLRVEQGAPANRFTRLRELDISGSSWSPVALIALLCGAKDSLTALNLSSTHVSNGVLRSGDDFSEVAAAVLRCGNLRRLNLGAPVDFVVPCLTLSIFTQLIGAVGDEGLGRFGTYQNVCSASHVTDKSFGALVELSFARNASVGDDILQKVAQRSPRLVRLDLRGTGVTRGGIAAFAENAPCAPHLQSLLLAGGESLDDATLSVVVSRCASLLELDLSMHALVSDDGIRALSNGCRQLQRLRISRNTKVTACALGELVKAGPLQTLSAVRCARAGEETLRSIANEGNEFRGACRIDVEGDDFEWTTGGG
jgi:hypothetical protein|tara:strand:- start:2247 stop:3524 length:1278 start_codon:yes stop_codon:yes gene_type:complete